MALPLSVCARAIHNGVLPTTDRRELIRYFLARSHMFPAPCGCRGRVGLPDRRGCNFGVVTMAAVTSGAAATGTKAKAKKGAEQRLKQIQKAAILLKQVSDPTRLQVILMLADGERHVGALCD